MSETEQQRYDWQGFFGPMSAAIPAYATVQIGPCVGVLIPATGGPLPVDLAATFGMFAVQTRTGAPMPCPPGMFEAVPAMVGRMVGA